MHWLHCVIQAQARNSWRSQWQFQLSPNLNDYQWRGARQGWERNSNGGNEGGQKEKHRDMKERAGNSTEMPYVMEFWCFTIALLWIASEVVGKQAVQWTTSKHWGSWCLAHSSSGTFGGTYPRGRNKPRPRQPGGAWRSQWLGLHHPQFWLLLPWPEPACSHRSWMSQMSRNSARQI